jgi:phosphoinositide-3-kinase regulatory subunit 4
MDIFSAGCVIAEILMDGLPLFDLPRLQQHRRGTFDVKEELQKRISDKNMVTLILQMIDRDPASRPSITKCLIDWNREVFPQSFSQVFYQLGASF